jgi:hypothetical protein
MVRTRSRRDELRYGEGATRIIIDGENDSQRRYATQAIRQHNTQRRPFDERLAFRIAGNDPNRGFQRVVQTTAVNG